MFVKKIFNLSKNMYIHLHPIKKMVCQPYQMQALIKDRPV